jgi:hypothetical protein
MLHMAFQIKTQSSIFPTPVELCGGNKDYRDIRQMTLQHEGAALAFWRAWNEWI